MPLCPFVEVIEHFYPLDETVTAFTAMNAEFFSSRAIMCPKNSDVELINQKILDRLPGDTFEFLSPCF